MDQREEVDQEVAGGRGRQIQFGATPEFQSPPPVTVGQIVDALAALDEPLSDLTLIETPLDNQYDLIPAATAAMLENGVGLNLPWLTRKIAEYSTSVDPRIAPFQVRSIPWRKFSDKMFSLTPTDTAEAAGGGNADSLALDPRHRLVLERMLKLGAVSSDTRKNADAIAQAVINRYATSDAVKQTLAELNRSGHVDSKKGRGGGSWLTEKGIETVRK